MPHGSPSFEKPRTFFYSDYDGSFLPRLSTDDVDVHQALLQRRRQLAGPMSKVTTSLAAMHFHDNDKRVDRRDAARRHLMGGLKNSLSPDRAGKLSLRRTQSMSGGSHANSNKNNHQWQRAMVADQVTASLQDSEGHRRPIMRLSSYKMHLTSDRDARNTIHNWNELVHELNASHRVSTQGSQGHLEIVSNSSENGSSSTDVVKCRQPAVISSESNNANRQGTDTTAAGGTLPAGIGITRYRPITPNLLRHLDKKKQTPRRRTQQWLNQLEIHRRRTNISMTISSKKSGRVVSGSPSQRKTRAANPPSSKHVHGFL